MEVSNTRAPARRNGLQRRTAAVSGARVMTPTMKTTCRADGKMATPTCRCAAPWMAATMAWAATTAVAHLTVRYMSPSPLPAPGRRPGAAAASGLYGDFRAADRVAQRPLGDREGAAD